MQLFREIFMAPARLSRVPGKLRRFWANGMRTAQVESRQRSGINIRNGGDLGGNGSAESAPSFSGSFESFKASKRYAFKVDSYFDAYDRLFGRFRGTDCVFVEVGVLHGGSLGMWRDFLGEKARIIGVELNPAARQFEKDGFEIFIGDQADSSFWKEFYSEVGDIDALLDDGGHLYEQQIATYVCSLPHVKDGGLLVVEDVCTSYMEDFGGPSPISFASFAKNVVDGINYRFEEFAPSHAHEKIVYSIEFFESIVAFHVNRKLAIPSARVHNFGKRTKNKDQRHNGTIAISATEIAKRFRY